VQAFFVFMTQEFLSWLQSLIAAGDVHPFYVSGEWRRLAADVMDLDLHECQICKASKRYRKAELVHHVNHVRRRPDLALDMFYASAEGERKRNLISVCRWCHENICHPERLRRAAVPTFVTEERWD
jgi:hypothetical protein